MRKKFLFTPGPTPIPTEALLAMAQPIDHHRTAGAAELINDVSEKLLHIFQTKHQPLILTSSGTGAMEAIVANLLSHSDRALVVRSGKFGERWGEICNAYRIEFDPIEVEWGKSVEPQLITDRLKSKKYKAIFTTLCETSTGALHDIKTIANITRESETLLVVDAISALGSDDLQCDQWGIDAVVSGSQKGLMSPPGLAFVVLNNRAWQSVENSDLPKYYFDLRKSLKSAGKGSTPYTPAISLIQGLQHSLRLICDEGIQNVIDRHSRLAVATRNAVEAMGLEIFPENPSNNLTSIKLPPSIDGKSFVKMMREKYGVTYAGGQGHLGGKIVRIAHLGWCCEHDVIVAISTLERGLREIGHQKFEVGSGVTAIQKSLSQ